MFYVMVLKNFFVAAYWEIAAQSAYDMFSQYKYLSVYLVLLPSQFWSGNFFLVTPFSDHCPLLLLNLQGNEFANISENYVFANIS